MSDIVRKLSAKIVFHPYFLFFRVEDRLYKKMLKKYAHGRVLDVGCGTSYYKPFLLRLRDVTSYFGIDYPEWFYNFDPCYSTSLPFGIFGKFAFRDLPLKANIYGDGRLLGIKDECADTGISIGVLEHVDEPILYLKEMYRVIKKGGILFMTIPFLYEAHGASDAASDYYRWTKSGITRILNNNGFMIKELLCYGKTGTMFSQLVNSYIIKRLDIYNPKKNFLLKLSRMILLIPFYLFVNLIGAMLDILEEDSSYTSGFCVIASKT